MNKRDKKNNIDKIVGKNIVKERTSRNMSRDELAEIMGMTTSHLGLIERGERGVTMVNFTKFTKVFDIPAEMLIGEPFKYQTLNEDMPEAIGFKNRNKLRTIINSFSDSEVSLLIHMVKGIQAYTSTEIYEQADTE